ncbi:MAG: antibiotic biosynthesis monooxygenase family protein [Terriglobales bacterium]
MFTRTVEITCKPGKNEELSNLVMDRVIPTLRKQPGFVDEITLISDTEPQRGMAISFWNTREDAERYDRNEYPKVRDMIQPLLESTPMVRTFQVDNSTVHKLAAGKAA